jgi:hypothetical protein
MAVPSFQEKLHEHLANGVVDNWQARQSYLAGMLEGLAISTEVMATDTDCTTLDTLVTELVAFINEAE